MKRVPGSFLLTCLIVLWMVTACAPAAPAVQAQAGQTATVTVSATATSVTPAPGVTGTPSPTLAPGQTMTPTASPVPGLTVTPSASPTAGVVLTPTFTPTPETTSTPLPSITPPPLFEPGTPLPLPLALISPENAHLVSALARWQERTVTDLAWTAEGDLAVATYDSIGLYDIPNRERFRTLYPRGEGVASLAFSPEGDWMVAGSRPGSPQEGYAGNLQLWQGIFLRPLGVLYSDPLAVSSLAFSPAGDTLAVGLVSKGFEQDMLQFWDTATWEITRTLQVGNLLNLTFSPDGARLATSPDRYAIHIWDLREGEILYRLHTSFTGAVNTLVFSPNGSLLASGHYDGTIRLWNTGNGQLVRLIETEGVVESLAFSPDNRILASGQSYHSHTLRLWRADSGELLRSLEGHDSAVTDLLFSPSGQYLVSASYDGNLRLWGIHPGASRGPSP